jgi:hypothetical protein
MSERACFLYFLFRHVSLQFKYMSSQELQLYGGALTISLPSSFIDVSGMRPMPDHQEIFCDTATDQSMVIEIVEMGLSEGNVAAYYLRDWIEQNKAISVAIEAGLHASPSETIGSSHLKESLSSHCQVYSISGRMTVGGANVLVHLAVLRLPRVSSDLLLTLSTPQPLDGSKGPLTNEILLESLYSLQIKDWTLFGSSEWDVI